jgi:hypothetical protein
MRIVSIPSPVKLMGAPMGGDKAAPSAGAKKSIKLGWEDIVIGLALLIIVVSWLQGRITPDQAISYLGFTAAGGVWGVFSGKE